jgi:nitrite reductase/ring-hydroxylating ferredoxin subunit
VRFEVERHGKPRPAFAVRVEGLVRAYENVCAHQSVELDWMPGEFFDEERWHLICATHGALYEPADGRCVAGPCLGARLVPLAVVERDGQVLLIE